VGFGIILSENIFFGVWTVSVLVHININMGWKRKQAPYWQLFWENGWSYYKSSRNMVYRVALN